jgi:branched-chain amino acid transport system permease protein
VTDFLQLAFSGLSQGAAYGLVAVGFVAVYSVTGVINLAQGELAMLAGFVAIALVAAGVPLALACLAAVAVVGVLAVVIERVAIAPAAGASTLTYIILTLGVSIALKAAALLIWGPDSRALPDFSSGTLTLGGVVVRPQELWVLGLTALAGLGLYAFYERTTLGKALRACAQQPVAARLVGIAPARMSRLAFLVAGIAGAVAGVVVSPINFTDWESGLLLGLKGFVAASLAGLVSIPGAIGGGLLLGVVESLSAGYLSSGLKDAIAFVILIAVLMSRPHGLFAREQGTRV